MKLMLRKTVLFTIVLLTSILSLAQTRMKPASELLQDIHRLNNVGTVLYVAAHPDDENTRLISYLTNDLKVDVSYLSLTRGDGGQNLIGTEIGDGLGLLRSHELLAARKIDGGHQFFSRAIDFGYSKTADETLKIWDEEKVLGDMVFVIRKVKPDVIITRFSPEENPERSTHGHHTASAKLALIAFEYAADPTKYPEQLKYYPVHKTKKLYWNTSYWFYGSEEKMQEEIAKNPDKYLKINANTYLPLAGKTCADISAMSRSQHKSQGFGSAPSVGEQIELLQLLKGEQKGDMLFSGIPLYWAESSEGKVISKKISTLITQFEVNSPEKSLPLLFELRALLTGLEQNPMFTSIIAQKLPAIDNLIVQCAGIIATAYTKERKYFAGEKVDVDLNVAAFSKYTAIELKGFVIHNLMGGVTSVNADLTQSNYNYKFEGKVDLKVPYSQPFWLKLDKKLGSYGFPDDPLNALQNISPYPFLAKLNLLINNQPIEIELPVLYSVTDPVKGHITQPLVITPDAMLNLDQEVYIFANNNPKTIAVELVNGKPGLDGYVELNLPTGWKSEPSFFKTTTGNKGEKQRFEFVVTPPVEQQSTVVRAMFKTDLDVYAVGINELLYDHVPNTAWFPTSEASLQKITLEKRGYKIGYLTGAGDKVPEALVEMGYTVELVSVDDLMQKTLNYDAIVIGIRAFNTIENIGNVHEKLMKFVENGGNVIVQYNTAHALKSKDIGPYNLTLSRDRVTEEDAVVTLLKPDHKVLNTPNKITAKDFSGWVQERGLYFPSEWDDKYEAILSMHDKGENPLSGSLLVGQYGKGYFVYTGISFFRELPAGVPGAYRLMANLISIGK